MKVSHVVPLLALAVMISGCMAADVEPKHRGTSMLTHSFSPSKSFQDFVFRSLTLSINYKASEEQGIVPKRLQIPSIQLDSPVEPVGLLDNGQMDVPEMFDRVGILSPWTKPGERGNAVIAGHVDHHTGPAVFYHLRNLKQGDRVFVSDENGKILTFQVKQVETFKTKDAPLDKIFGKAEQPQLNLITCAGRFNRKTGEHAARLVVFSEMLQ